jgi:methionyl-tRNA formyltransferase
MRVIFAGTPAVAVPTLQALNASAHDIVGILTRQDAPVGRSRTLTRSPVAQWGDDNGIGVIEANRPDARTCDDVASVAPDVGVIVAYGALLDSDMLTVPTRGWVNLHFSDLPKYRGAAPVQRALLAGETDIATAVFQLVESMDAGPIFDVEHHAVPSESTSGEVLTFLAAQGAHQVVRVLDALESRGLQAHEQVGVPSFAPKLTSQDARLDPRGDVTMVFNLFRAVTPEPGAWIETTAGRVKVSAATVLVAPRDFAPGVIVEHEGTAVLGCESGALVLQRVTPAGKRDMPGSEWLRGIRSPHVSVVNP